MKNTIISLHGSYFGNNYGDILLVNMFASWIKEEYPEAIINMPLANRNKTRELPEGTTSLLKLINSKALVFCGGGYFGEQPKNKRRWAIRNFYRHAIVAIIAKVFHIPYAIIGVEFGPISETWFRKVCIKIADNASVLVVRNNESKQFLEQYGITKALVSVDAVLSLSDIIKVETPLNDVKKIIVHINAQGNLPPNFLNVNTLIVNAAQRNIQEFELLFISDGDGRYYDNIYCEELFSTLDKYGIRYSVPKYTGINDLINLINSSDFIFTTKLHVGITAASLNKKVFSLWFHNKTPRLHYQIENSKYCYPFESFIDQDNVLDTFFQSGNYVLPKKVFNTAMINKNELMSFLKNNA